MLFVLLFPRGARCAAQLVGSLKITKRHIIVELRVDLVRLSNLGARGVWGNLMIDIFLGTSYDNVPTGELKKQQVSSFRDFCERYLKTCLRGKKHDYYITIGDKYEITKGEPSAPPMSYRAQDHYHRNNKSQISAWLLPFDGDSSVNKEGCCIEPSIVHTALISLGYNHVIYTTHSHEMGTKNRWRLFIPCKMSSPEQLTASVNLLYKQLKANGCKDLALSAESKTWSTPWYLPTRDDPSDGHFEYFEYFQGRDFLPVNVIEKTEGDVSKTEESRSITSMLEIIAKGESDTGLHAATRDLAYGLVKDGVTPGTVKAILHFVTSHYCNDSPRQIENKSKIDPLVDSAVKKVVSETPPSIDWIAESLNKRNDVFTDYPSQGGMMEQLVDTCMKWMIYPNRQIAVIAAHALISTLGGRVYTLRNGSGIVLTALVTGRSTIGKSFIKKFCIFALNNFQLANVSQDFIGSHFYTSSKNLVDELSNSGSLLSVRTESGHADKSNAGDMTRVLMYELELATESGRNGYVSSGGQNDKIPPLFSPSMTTIRESVAQIQNEADVINATTISGVAGRRSHVLIDSVKGERNESPITELPPEIKRLILELYKKAANEQRKKVTAPLPADLWITVNYKNPVYLSKKQKDWLAAENIAASRSQHFEATFFGRLGERLPAWAARLAIVDNPDEPVITNQHIDIAEASLLAEICATNKQQESGELDTDFEQTVKCVLELFKGDMTQNKGLRHERNMHMLRDGACEVSKIFNVVRTRAVYKKAASHVKTSIEPALIGAVKSRGIILLSKEEAMAEYKYKGPVFKRI